MATESLIPDRSLFNPKFEGYKLPPDEVDVKTTNLVSDVKVVSPRDDLFSLQYIRAFGSYNHLVVDRWQTNCERVFFVDENNEVQQATVKVSGRLIIIFLLGRSFEMFVVVLLVYVVNVKMCKKCAQNSNDF